MQAYIYLTLGFKTLKVKDTTEVWNEVEPLYSRELGSLHQNEQPPPPAPKRVVNMATLVRVPYV
jgi:hypothetical protein